MWNFNFVVVSQKTLFFAPKKGKMVFACDEKENFLLQLVSNPKMHMCVQYGHIITNYATILAITLVMWPKSYKTSNMIAYFVKVFLWCF
jgi:hypothetical protein